MQQASRVTQQRGIAMLQGADQSPHVQDPVAAGDLDGGGLLERGQVSREDCPGIVAAEEHRIGRGLKDRSGLGRGQHHRDGRLAGDDALVAPHRYQPGPCRGQGRVEEVGIGPLVAGAVEGAARVGQDGLAPGRGR